MEAPTGRELVTWAIGVLVGVKALSDWLRGKVESSAAKAKEEAGIVHRVVALEELEDRRVSALGDPSLMVHRVTQLEKRADAHDGEFEDVRREIDQLRDDAGL